MARRKRDSSHVTAIGRRQYGPPAMMAPPRGHHHQSPKLEPEICLAGEMLVFPCKHGRGIQKWRAGQAVPRQEMLETVAHLVSKPRVNRDTEALLFRGADLLREDSPRQRTQQPLRLAEHPGLFARFKLDAKLCDRQIEERRSTLQPMRHGDAVNLGQNIMWQILLHVGHLQRSQVWRRRKP